MVIAIAGTITPCKVTGTLPGSGEDHFNILRSHPRIQVSKLPWYSRSCPGAIRIAVQSKEARSSASDIQITTTQKSENSGTRANQAGAVSIADKGTHTAGRGDGNTDKGRRAGDQRDLVADSETSPSEMSPRQTKQRGRTSSIHRHLEPHNLTGASHFFPTPFHTMGMCIHVCIH